MANIESGLFDTERQLSSMIEASGKTVPVPGERTNIVEHLDYIIALLGTMVSDETYNTAKKKMAAGYNAINDRIEIVNWLLSSGEISGDIDVEPLTITKNGEYMPGAGKAFSRVMVNTPTDRTPELIARELSIIENSAVTKIGNSAFHSYESLTSVSFPECSYIGSSAFNYCTSLASVSFPECSYIGSHAFYGCSSLTSVSFPECSYIGSQAFRDCSNLTEINCPKCTSICDGVFYYCSSLTSVSFPECSYIGSSAFNYCSSLTSVSFPECSYLGISAFDGCTSLTSASFSECSYIGASAFNWCISLTSVSFPKCTYIDSYAFRACSSLTSVSFPECSYIGASAFVSCTSLNQITINASTVCVLSNSNAFTNTDIYANGGSIFVPASLIDNYKTASNWSYFSQRFFAIE